MSRQAVEMLGGPGARKGKINRETADHTPGFAIGAVLLKGRLSHADYDALLGDEKVLALMANISLHEDSEATGAYPRKRGLDHAENKALVLKHLQGNRGMGSPISELHQVLPALSASRTCMPSI